MENQINESLSRGVVLFLGFGIASWPRNDLTQIIEEFGAVDGPVIGSQVVALVDEAKKIEVDWPTHTLVSVGEKVREVMHTRHPYLSDEALHALAWKFTFDWR